MTTVDEVAISRVAAVSRSGGHTFSKKNEGQIRLIAGFGVEGDAHGGANVQHLSRMRHDPNQPNLRQVHLIHGELHEHLRTRGYDVSAGEMGENITTSGIDLLGLPTGARLVIGKSAVVQITGLRSPCIQLDNLQNGLKSAVLDRDADGNLVRLAGVMGIVLESGEIRPGDPITIELPPLPHEPLQPV